MFRRGCVSRQTIHEFSLILSLCDGKYGIIPGYFSPSTPDLTVVCPTYYLSKKPLDHLCTAGDTIASQGSECACTTSLPKAQLTKATEGSWFLHRLLHLKQATGGGLSDVVDSAHDAVDLAQGVNVSGPGSKACSS